MVQIQGNTFLFSRLCQMLPSNRFSNQEENLGTLYLLWNVCHHLHVALNHILGPLSGR